MPERIRIARDRGFVVQVGLFPKEVSVEVAERDRLFALLFELWTRYGWTLEDVLIMVRTARMDWEAAEKERQ